MSNAIFVDNGAWIALIFPRDPLHRLALRRFDELERQERALVTTSLALAEVLDGLASHHLRFLAAPFRTRLSEMPHLENRSR